MISVPKSKHLKTLFMRFPNYRNEISGCEDVNKSEAKKYRFLEARFLIGAYEYRLLQGYSKPN